MKTDYNKQSSRKCLQSSLRYMAGYSCDSALNDCGNDGNHCDDGGGMTNEVVDTEPLQ